MITGAFDSITEVFLTLLKVLKDLLIPAMSGLPSKISNFAHKCIPFVDGILRWGETHIGIIIIVLCALLVPFLFYLVGFTPSIAAGSLAAIWQASIGNVVAGSIFAILQSLGTKLPLLAGIGLLIGAAGYFLHSLLKSFWGDGSPSHVPEK